MGELSQVFVVLESMKYTLEVPDQDAEFVLEFLRRVTSVKLTPARSKKTVQDTTEYLLSTHANRERLGHGESEQQSISITPEERARRFEAVAGSWQSEETGDELNQQLRAARYFRDRDIEL